MSATILIPNKSDTRVERMIKSIDYYGDKSEKLEILMVLNKPTEEIICLTEKLKNQYKDKFIFSVINISKSNLGLAYNEGIKYAKYNNVVFIDTDLICEPGALKKLIEYQRKKNSLIVKANLIYKDMNFLVKSARLVNTTNVIVPYIPVILLNKKIFWELSDNTMFAVDTVWCSDAEFGYRVLNEKVKIDYVNCKFYHDRLTLKKDIKDAFLYGFGKSIRVKRTKEKWEPFKEIINMYRQGKIQLSLIGNLYSVFWISCQQLGCLIQYFKKPIFKESMPYESSMKREELLINEKIEI